MEIIKFNDFLSGDYKRYEKVEGLTKKESDFYDVCKGLVFLSLILICAPHIISVTANFLPIGVEAFKLLP